MHQRRTEPGLIKIFRDYCGFALLYFLVFFAFTVVIIREIFSAKLIFFYLNLTAYSLLFGYLSWVQLEKKLGYFYFPIAIFFATVIPMYSTNFFWPFETSDALSNIIYRSWYLFPILIVPITLFAWQYGYKLTLIFIIFTALYDLPFIIMRIKELNLQTVQLLGVPIQRSIAFGTAGIIVGLLMHTQRLQRKKLIHANLMLSRYANTLEELATSRERNRLARELHDTLAHTLSSQILTMEALRLSPPSKKHELQTALKQLIDNSRQGLLETRRALKDLRAKQLEDLGLKTSLEFLMADATSRSECDMVIKIDDQLPAVPKNIEQCIYRIAQEGIENIIKHSNATTTSLSLSFAKNNVLQLEIFDNGHGFDPSTIDSMEKHGVKGMRERVNEVGGAFKISSHKNKGTKIIAAFMISNDTLTIM